MSAAFILSLVLIVAIMMLGVPVAYSFLWGSLFYLVISHESLGAVVSTSFNSANSYSYLAIPLFVLAGRLMVSTTIAERLVVLAETLLRKVKGGMGAAVILAAAFFGTVTGSDIATATAVGNIMFPRMLRSGWDKRYIGAVLAAAAPLGYMIPPNTNAIMFSAITNVSVPALFLSTIIPGVIWAVLMFAINGVMYKKYYHPENAEESVKQETVRREEKPENALTEIKSAAYQAIPAIIMPVIILGGIYSGIFTSTEAGGVAGLYSILAGLILFRTMSVKTTWKCFSETSKDLGVIMFIVATSAVFSRIMLLHKVPTLIATGLIGVSDNAIVIMLIIDVIYLISGCFLSPPVILFVITPLLIPTARAIGLGDIQLGVMLFVSIGIGVITPPMAGNLFISARMAKCNVWDIVPPVMPYLLFAGIPVLLLVTFIPELSLFLPNLLNK